MNSSHSSRLLLAVLVVVVAGAGIAGAVQVADQNVPTTAEVGTDQSATVTIDQLFQEPATEEWTLRVETELTNVTWTIQLVNQAGTVFDQMTGSGQSIEQAIDIDNGEAEVTVKVTGTVPGIQNYSYDPAPRFIFAEFTQVRQGGTENAIETYRTRHYTTESLEARQAIEDAQAAIDDAGGHAGASDTLNDAKEFYQVQQFEQAVDAATRAQNAANQARSQSQLIETALWVVAALVLVGIIVGAVLWYRSSRQSSRL